MFSWLSKRSKRADPPDVTSGRDAVIRVIDDPAASTEDRKAAVRRIEAYKDPASVAALVRVVQNESLHDLRTDAAGRLGFMGALAAAAVDALIGSLDNPPIPATGHRRVVITALGRIGDRRAVPLLLQELMRGNLLAASALENIASDWRDWPETAEAARRLAGSLLTEGPVAGLALEAIDPAWRTGAAAKALLGEMRSLLVAAVAQGSNPDSLDGRAVFRAAWLAAQIAAEPDAELREALEALHQSKTTSFEKSHSFATVALERIAPDYVAPFAAEVSGLLDRLTSTAATEFEMWHGIGRLEDLLGSRYVSGHAPSGFLGRIKTSDVERLSKLDKSVSHSVERTRDDEPSIGRSVRSTGALQARALAELELRRGEIR